MTFPADDLTQDAFLGGRLQLWQPRDGYRAGIDPVLLAASVSASSGQTVLDLGCGAGAAGLCLATRVPGLAVRGVELQPDYADLARRNAAFNGLPFEIATASLTSLPRHFREISFDHVIANPPFFREGAHSHAQDTGRRTALGEETPLDDWVRIAARRLAPKGYLHVIHRMNRLPDLLAACCGRLGSLQVLPLAARKGRAPEMMILRARKSGRADFVLQPPLILHKGTRHARDGDSYSTDITDVLRGGAALTWPAKG